MSEDLPFEDQLADPTLLSDSVSAEAATGEFTELVPAGTAVPVVEVPITVRIGIDPVPEGSHVFVEPSLADIGQAANLDRRAWLLYGHLRRNAAAPSLREREMINALIVEEGWVFVLLSLFLSWSPAPPKPKRVWLKRPPTRALAPAPSLFEIPADERSDDGPAEGDSDDIPADDAIGSVPPMEGSDNA